MPAPFRRQQRAAAGARLELRRGRRPRWLEQPFASRRVNVVDDDLPTAAEYVRRYKKEVRRIPSIRCPFFATMLLSNWAERWHVSSGGQIPRVLTPYRTASLWRGHRFDNRKLRRAGWTQVVQRETVSPVRSTTCVPATA